MILTHQSCCAIRDPSQCHVNTLCQISNQVNPVCVNKENSRITNNHTTFATTCYVTNCGKSCVIVCDLNIAHVNNQVNFDSGLLFIIDFDPKLALTKYIIIIF